MLYIVFIKLDVVYVKLNEKSGFLCSEVSPIFYSSIEAAIVQVLLQSQVIVKIKMK